MSKNEDMYLTFVIIKLFAPLLYIICGSTHFQPATFFLASTSILVVFYLHHRLITFIFLDLYFTFYYFLSWGSSLRPSSVLAHFTIT